VRVGGPAWGWRAIGVALLVLPLLPVPQWVGAPDRGPGTWSANLSVWSLGIALVSVGAFLPGRMWRGAAERRFLPAVGNPVWVAGLSLVLAVAAAVTMRRAFAGNPNLIDEMAQLFQARVFAAGRLTAPAPQPSNAFLFQLTSLTAAGWISQFPPGQSALLALGMLLRAEWLVNPLLGGVATILMYLTARGLYGPKTGRLAALLWALSGFVLFMSATYMNHVGAVAFALGSWALLLGPKRVTAGHALGAGACLAALAATRPLDAVVAVLPLLVILIQQPRQWNRVPWVALGAVPILAAWGYYNWRTLGRPLALGYTVLYGPGHGLGFHIDPYGESYTPLVALSNFVVGLRRLHIYLYEWPIPGLLPVGIWALAASHRHPGDAVVAMGVAAAPALYFFYWHSGFYLGPRFYFLAVPWLVIGLARAWRWFLAKARGRRLLGARLDVALGAAAVIVILWGIASFLPARFASNQRSFPTFKLHPERDLAARGVTRALVVVPESWGSRVVASLWALGAPPGLVEVAYRRLDLCDLHRMTLAARASNASAQAVTQSLETALAATPDPVPRVSATPDPSLRLRPDRALPPDCASEVRRDLAGFTTYGSLAWRNSVDLETGIVFARELPDDSTLVARYRGWERWRFAPPAGQPTALPTLMREDGPLP